MRRHARRTAGRAKRRDHRVGSKARTLPCPDLAVAVSRPLPNRAKPQRANGQVHSQKSPGPRLVDVVRANAGRPYPAAHGAPSRPVWHLARRLYDFKVWSEKKRREKLDYMHGNPDQRGLVRSPDQRLWSSLRFYFLGDDCILPVDRLP
jgi:hypothetical protein